MRQGLERAGAAWLRERVEAEDVPWTALTPAELDRVRAMLADDLAPASVNKILSAVRGLVREARRQGAIADERANALIAAPWLPLDDVDAKPVRALTRREADDLYAACVRGEMPAARRDLAVLWVFLSCGLRRAELAGLRVADFDGRRGRLRIEPANPDKARTIFLHRPAAEAVRAWRAVHGACAGPLFPSINKAGRVGSRPMTPQGVYDLVRRRGVRAGVDDLTSRRLRRTCAIALIAAGEPIERIQQRLGNASWMSPPAFAALAAEAGEALDLDALPHAAATDRRPPDEPAIDRVKEPKA